MKDVKNAAFVHIFCGEDKERVEPVIEKMRNKGFPVWYPPEENKDSREWKTRLSVKLDKAYAVILYITGHITEGLGADVLSQYDEAHEIGKVIIPVFLDNVDIQSAKAEYRSYITQWQTLQGVPYTENQSAEVLSDKITSVINNSTQINYSHTDNTPKSLQDTEPAKPEIYFPHKPKRNYLMLIAAIIESVIAVLLFFILITKKSFDYILFAYSICLIAKVILCVLLSQRSVSNEKKSDDTDAADNNTDISSDISRKKSIVYILLSLVLAYAFIHQSYYSILMFYIAFIDKYNIILPIVYTNLALSPLILWFLLFKNKMRSVISSLKKHG